MVRQLFNTLFSNRNKQLRKFNKLANAIIILDEVQAVPHRYWQLIHDALKLLCDKFNSYVILITATQPLIFEEGKGEIQEIAERKEEYFRGLDRIDLMPMVEKALILDEFKVILKKDLEECLDQLKRYRKIGYKNVCKMLLGEATPEKLKGVDPP